MTVTALLVSHDGARWLPAVLEGLLAQTRPPDRVLAVDTGSTDGSLDLLAERLGSEAVLSLRPRTSYPDAVSRGLQSLAGDTAAADADDADDAWVWLLHDDSRPAPDALERLLEAAAADPSAAILGAKLREWPSLRRLLEVGATMSGTGRRETGLERGEYDQGQHDRTREVLAVSSAGMLVRRSVLDDLGGFDRSLPIFGNDLDLGWRAARAGHRTLVVPDAVVFHAEAAHRGARRTGVTGNHRRGERRAALYTLLVNSAPAALPFLLVRLVLGSLLRALGLLLVRAPREAFDELVALVSAYARADLVVRGRLRRRRSSTVPARDVRHLLAPFWLPYRHGLDFLSDIAMAVVHQAGDVSSARRAARAAAAETGPVSAEAQSLPPDTGLLARLLGSRTALGLGLLVVLALVAGRGLLGTGLLAGGALLPAPSSVGHWWQLHLESWHDVGVGSGASAGPFVLPLALAGTVLLGKAWLLVDLVMLLAVPLAAWGAGRLLRRLVGPGWVSFWGAAAYAVLPMVTGAVSQGRLGTVAASLVLPWVAHAALFLAPRPLDPGPVTAGTPARIQDRRWRAAWRTALLLALLTAFAPVAWPIAVVLALVAVVAGALTDRSTWTAPRTWLPVLVAVLAVPVLLLPWAVLGLLGGPRPWYAEAGLAASDLLSDLDAWHLLAGRAADLGAAPLWIGLPLGVAAVAALTRRNTRPRVLVAWAVIVVGLAATALLDARGEWAGFAVVLTQGAAVAAVAIAGSGITSLLSGRSFGWRQPIGLLVVAGAVLSPLAGLVWWVADGSADPLDRGPAQRIPAYMTDASLRDPDQGILVVRSEGTGLGYSIVRGDGVRIGDDTVAPDAAASASLTALVTDLATAPTADDVANLSRYGVEFVYLPPPADPGLVGNLDSVSGLASASALRRGSRAWQLEAEPSRDALEAPEGSPRTPLLVAQGLALLAALVLAAPSRRVRR